ncbi:hypothetical protein [Microbulbifer sp. YPW1]|uniref:hypothetical protein n=1 Tax=unclassified Microbulbifer TaxID=2619833 RepID=UPI00159968C4|nr:hypothetical protein [Microbulbifer sp. YPW1]QKX17656.1 hypothetical protein HUW35_12040 [Microbulbifer sp. YPW1]
MSTINMEYLIKEGRELLQNLEDLASSYHVKSDMHEKLSWETVGIGGMLSQLVSGSELTYSLISSNLEKEWGQELVDSHPDLFKRVYRFRDAYYRAKNT